MYLFWMVGDEPVGNAGKAADVSGQTSGVDGIGGDWIQPFVKGPCMGLRQAGNDGQVWVATGDDDKTDDWVRAEDFIDIDEYLPCVLPTAVGIFMHSDPRSRHHKPEPS